MPPGGSRRYSACEVASEPQAALRISAFSAAQASTLTVTASPTGVARIATRRDHSCEGR